VAYTIANATQMCQVGQILQGSKVNRDTFVHRPRCRLLYWQLRKKTLLKVVALGSIWGTIAVEEIEEEDSR